MCVCVCVCVFFFFFFFFFFFVVCLSLFQNINNTQIIIQHSFVSVFRSITNVFLDEIKYKPQ